MRANEYKITEALVTFIKNLYATCCAEPSLILTSQMRTLAPYYSHLTDEKTKAQGR